MALLNKNTYQVCSLSMAFVDEERRLFVKCRLQIDVAGYSRNFTFNHCESIQGYKLERVSAYFISEII
jgi:hypothetical protein